MVREVGLLSLIGLIMNNVLNWRDGMARITWFVGLVVALMFSIIVTSGYADESKPPPFNGYSKYVWYRSHYQVNADGTDVETHEWALKVLSEQGISDATQGSVDYSGSLQDAEITSAYTLKADGRRINVPAANFQEQINKGKGEASPMFSDVRTKMAAFPDVAVGDTVVMSYKIVQKEAMFPGNFSFTEAFSKFEAYDSAEVSITAPSKLKLFVYQRGVAGGEIANSKDGQRNWRWSYRNEEVAAPEPGAVSALDSGPLVVASTFKDYGAVAAAFNVRAAPKAVVTPAIKRLANELTANAHNTRAETKAIYDWVAVNIQYAGDDVGVGPVVPHAADLILTNRMGDCKDHSILMQALLAAKGIASSPVLINAGNAYSLPPVASADVFNHMINYIPALNLYADSTSRYTAFGTLPLDDAGKPVVHTVGFTEIHHTPPSTYKDNRLVVTTVLKIDAQGAADGTTTIEETGFRAGDIRAGLAELQPNMEERVVQRLLDANGFSGSGTLRKDDTNALTNTFSYGSSYHLTDAYIIPGPAALNVRSPFAGSSMANYVKSANETHTMNFSCYGVDWEQQYTITLPNTVKILAIPRNVVLSGKDLSYRAEYQLKGHIVTAVQELQDRTPESVCTPADAAATKEFARGIRRDLQAQVLYQ
jgi:transglutaminase-like putative cysteine protease